MYERAARSACGDAAQKCRATPPTAVHSGHVMTVGLDSDGHQPHGILTISSSHTAVGPPPYTGSSAAVPDDVRLNTNITRIIFLRRLVRRTSKARRASSRPLCFNRVIASHEHKLTDRPTGEGTEIGGLKYCTTTQLVQDTYAFI